MHEKLGHSDLNGFDMNMRMNRNAIIFFQILGAVLYLPANQRKQSSPIIFMSKPSECPQFFMHNILSTTGVNSNQSKRLVNLVD
jgi:hypothetical protein